MIFIDLEKVPSDVLCTFSHIETAKNKIKNPNYSSVSS